MPSNLGNRSVFPSGSTGINVKDKGGCTALHIAAQNGHAEGSQIRHHMFWQFRFEEDEARFTSASMSMTCRHQATSECGFCVLEKVRGMGAAFTG